MGEIFTPLPKTKAHPINIAPALAALGFLGWEVAGQRVIIPPVCAISAGPFLMGIDVATIEKHHLAYNASPLHIVMLPRFAIGRFPLTFAEYALSLSPPEIAAYQQRTSRETPWLPQEPDAIASVTWEECWHYTTWLRQLTGLPWRLPNEAEWEKAARGEDGRTYPWGEDPADERTPHTLRIGQNTPNASPSGMEDAIGLAEQWTTSLSLGYPYDPNDGREAYADRPYSAPSRPIARRVKRGSGWPASDARSRLYDRKDDDPWSCLQDLQIVGGRLALDLDG